MRKPRCARCARCARSAGHASVRGTALCSRSIARWIGDHTLYCRLPSPLPRPRPSRGVCAAHCRAGVGHSRLRKGQDAARARRRRGLGRVLPQSLLQCDRSRPHLRPHLLEPSPQPGEGGHAARCHSGFCLPPGHISVASTPPPHKAPVVNSSEVIGLRL